MLIYTGKIANLHGSVYYGSSFQWDPLAFFKQSFPAARLHWRGHKRGSPWGSETAGYQDGHPGWHETTFFRKTRDPFDCKPSFNAGTCVFSFLEKRCWLCWMSGFWEYIHKLPWFLLWTAYGTHDFLNETWNFLFEEFLVSKHAGTIWTFDTHFTKQNTYYNIMFMQ